MILPGKGERRKPPAGLGTVVAGSKMLTRRPSGRRALLRSPVRWRESGRTEVKMMPWTKRTISVLKKKKVRLRPL
jgi:hypothetical protein